MDDRAEDEAWLAVERACEAVYLRGTNPRAQSGFGRDERDWEKYRRPVVAAVDHDGTYLDIGCANGLLMESVVAWCAADGFRVEPHGVDLSESLAALARSRLPQWSDRIHAGNALTWDPPRRYDYVRTELCYVPHRHRRAYVERLLDRFVVDGGRVILCSYGSSRPEGARGEPLLDELEAWGLVPAGVCDVVSEAHGFVTTRAVWLARPGAP